jgi:hypothetical protein
VPVDLGGQQAAAQRVTQQQTRGRGARARELEAHANVKRYLTGWQLLALMSAKFLRSFFGDWYLQRFLSVVSV